MRGTRILGVDFTSAPRAAKPITIASGAVRAGVFMLESIETAPDWTTFESVLARPGPWVGGFDFPFGLPRAAVRDLGWPQDWPRLVAHCAGLGRSGFRAALDAYRETRPFGDRYAHRLTDRPARSHSPLKLVNPPVGLMFLEGAPRLAAAGVTIAGIRAGDPTRIALEAYPALAARTITRESYKSDERAQQTAARRDARMRIVRALAADDPALGIRLEASAGQCRALVADASGDRLDAVLAALQAAWAWRRRARNFGLPAAIDPLEGWIIGAQA